jgi:Na+/proline symporter
MAYMMSLTCVLVSQFVGFAKMASAVGFDYKTGVIFCAVTICLLAFGSGLLGVAVTDAIQYLFILILLPVTAYFSMSKLQSLGISVGQLVSEPFFPTDAHFSKFMYILWPYVFGNMFNYEYFMRYQSCKGVKEARKACAVAGLCLLVIALPVALLGAIANYCYNGQNVDTVFQQIIANDLPPVCGYALTIVVLMAILTTADSFLSSISAIASKDFYGNLLNAGKDIKELKHTRLVARVAMVIACTVAAVLALKFDQILTIIFIFSPLTTGVFWAPIIIGMFWKGASKKGMICSVIAAATVGILHMLGIIHLFDRLVGTICVSVITLIVCSLLFPNNPKKKE